MCQSFGGPIHWSMCIIGSYSMFACLSVEQGIDEVVLGADWIATGMEQHRTMPATIDTCAAGDGERTIGAII